ncbi:hypothetical protein E8E12_003852 [Didymella heteroderae]|uniref:Oxidoreductase n=1 Tax=Didymella heteroderae TaxID=1769908 RepID=A0A9P5BYD2_9PLEO|nr:hypothetical protein E8E12_003852 [Didymella heteroderae]
MDNTSLFDVKGKVVLVTGGAKGIGRMISEGFVQNGANVYVSSRDAKACEQACKELNALGKGKADFIAADLYKEEDIKRIADELKKRAGKLDVLVNNSGSNWGESYDTYPSAAWDRVLTLNLKRVFQLTQAVTPLLEAAQSSTSPSRVINIGSVDGLRVPALETFAYSASKAGLHHMSRVLASHLGKRGITSNTIACGPFQSKMMKATLEKFKDVIESGIPLGRIGSPEDVAALAIIFDWAASYRGLEYTLVSKASVTEKLKISLAPLRHGGKSALAAVALILIVATQTPVALNRAYNPVLIVPAGKPLTKEVRVTGANTMRAYEVETGTPCEVILRRFDVQNASCVEQDTKQPEDYWVYVEATNTPESNSNGSLHRIVDQMGVDNNQTRGYNASVRTGGWYLPDYMGYDLMERWKIARISEGQAHELMSPWMSLYPENVRGRGGHQLCEEVTTQKAHNSNDTILVYRSARVWMRSARNQQEALADLMSLNVDEATMALLRNNNNTSEGMSVVIGDVADGVFELTAFSADKRQGPAVREYVTRALSLRIAVTKLGEARNTDKINWYKKTVEEDGTVSFEMPATRGKEVDPLELYRYLRVRNWSTDGTTLPLTVRHTEGRIKAAIIIPMITLQLLVLLLAAVAVFMTPPVFAQSIAQTIYETTAVRNGDLAKRSWFARFFRAEPVVEGGMRLTDTSSKERVTVAFKNVALEGTPADSSENRYGLVSLSQRPKDVDEPAYSKLSTSGRTETDELGSMRLHGSFGWEPRPRA